MLRIVVAEDSKTVRRLLVEILEADPEITVVGEAANGIEAVERVVELAPDLVVMDVTAGGRVLLARATSRRGMQGWRATDGRERDLSWLDWSRPAAISLDGERVLFDEPSGMLDEGDEEVECLGGEGDRDAVALQRTVPDVEDERAEPVDTGGPFRHAGRIL